MNPVDSKKILEEVSRRRTFAIISHPDAGKTTLTEKLLLMGGAIRLAGSVKAKKSKKFATSDWMDLEKQRGISVSTSVMNFQYQDIICNLLDTPGHQDFSEDTYRTLAAADSAIMLLDGAKGVEPQTIKLFEVCRLRKIPIFTFVNKMDRDSRDPFELMQELEEVLKIPAYPMNWPISSGDRFGGVVQRKDKMLHFYEKKNASVEHEEKKFQLPGERDQVEPLLAPDVLQEALDGLELLDAAGDEFHYEEFVNGKITPLFFGSAMSNFGVRLFLEKFLEMSPPPSQKRASSGMVSPLSEKFSGFVFKIQANMDPKHRDRIAFLRVVSGVYQAGMNAYIPRLNREIRLTQPQQFFAQDRTSLNIAYAGDVVGIYDPGLFSIGDSLVEDGQFEFEGIPSFAPENFALLRTNSALKRKQLMKGLQQLCQEGTVQLLVDEGRALSDPIVAAVGVLQFDVLLFRLKNEYNVDCTLEPLPFKLARWTNAQPQQIQDIKSKLDMTAVKDVNENYVFLFKNEFNVSYFTEHYPNISLYKDNSPLRQNMMTVTD